MYRKWIAGVLSAVLLIGLPFAASAETPGQLADESIYDLLVDRFFNKKIDNDYEVDGRDPNVFTGGDFHGLTDNLDYIRDLGFTAISIGPVFPSDSYDGRQALDYSQLERHFGTEEEFRLLIEEAGTGDQSLKVIVDVPTQSLSPDHTWMSTNPEWFSETADGTVALDTSNNEVQAALIEAFGDFIATYDVAGLRLQDSDELDPDFVTAFSGAMKEIRNIYVIGDAEMEAAEGLDATVLPGMAQTLRDAYKNFDQGLSDLTPLLEQSAGHFVQVDSLDGTRFTADIVDERGFPPTRWNVLLTQLLTMPGIPVMQYGSEIAINGESVPETHQIMDIGIKEELHERLADLNSIRNKSAALRTGAIEVLHDEDDWLIYKRWNDEESWIIAINNSSSTKQFNIPADVVGNDKELRGLFESDIVRESSDGEYRITLDREIGEAFHVKDSQGLNIAYVATLIIMYLLFMLFLWFVWRKGKQRKADEAKKAGSESAK